MNLDHLAQLATEATPGPWGVPPGTTDVMSTGGYDVAYVNSQDARDELNLAYIAAANPSVVLALVEVARAAIEVDAMPCLTNSSRLRDALAKLDQEGKSWA